ncbi:Pycsar system effector family protein [Polymorphospora sp. NPDC050346]|uniref:Pycsar system effector family protein n=1 Tax=Polymorphospora sp. NPDC050346 TaxID=3155780 RepID=UPI0033E48890
MNTRTVRPSRPVSTPRHEQIAFKGGTVNVLITLTWTSWECTCGATGDDKSSETALVQAGRHAAGCGHATLVDTLDGEIATARAEMTRVDPKAAGYLSVAGLLLGAGLAVLGGAGAGGNLTPATLISGGLTAAAVLASITLLLLAGRPRLDGKHGFVAYATAVDPGRLLDVFADREDDGPATPIGRARQLWWLSRALRAKYVAIRGGCTLLLVGFAGTAVTTVIALSGW